MLIPFSGKVIKKLSLFTGVKKKSLQDKCFDLEEREEKGKDKMNRKNGI